MSNKNFKFILLHTVLILLFCCTAKNIAAQKIEATLKNKKIASTAKIDTGYNAPKSYKGYRLKWADEFNGPSLNLKNWTFENGDGCPTICGWGNNELEYYRPENTSFKNGKMTIEAKKEDYGNKNFTSSKMVTRDKKVFKFGRIDFRAKLPQGQGIWPAFWMLPQHSVFGKWPQSGEIDIMEMIGKEPSKNYGTLHFGPGPESTQLGKNIGLPTGIFNDAFHIFSLEWSENEIKWFLDGKLFSSFSKKDFGEINYPFNKDFFLIINLQIGRNRPGNSDINMYKNQFLVVDYVRVFEKKK